jgi:hypothetical protein
MRVPIIEKIVTRLDMLEASLSRFYGKHGPVRPMFMAGVAVIGAVWLLLPPFLDLSESIRWDIGTKIIGGLLVCAGLWMTWQRIQVSNKQAQAALVQAQVAADQAETTRKQAAQQAETAARQLQAMEDGQVTERFTKAIAQLGASQDGKPSLEVRLGGIFSLERIARDSEKDHWTVMEVLCAYVRENAWIGPPIEAEKKEGGERAETVEAEEKEIKPRVDIQAALTVIKRREKREEPGQVDLREANLRRTNLQEANLRGAYLQRAKLQRAILTEANLLGARLNWADLRGADLRGAKLQRASLEGANLEKANLMEAKLQRASLAGAILQRARLGGARLAKAFLFSADLRRADLRRADLGGARYLTKEHLAQAIISKETILPSHLEEHRSELLESSKRNREEWEREREAMKRRYKRRYKEELERHHSQSTTTDQPESNPSTSSTSSDQ